MVGRRGCSGSTASPTRPSSTIPGSVAACATTPGIGAAVEAPAPFGTLVAVEWGYGFRGVNADGRRGTHVVRVSGYKVF